MIYVEYIIKKNSIKVHIWSIILKNIKNKKVNINKTFRFSITLVILDPKRTIR